MSIIKSLLVLLVITAVVVVVLLTIAQPGDGQVSDAVVNSQATIHDVVETAFESDTVIDVETHESPLPALWDWAETIMKGE